VNKAADQYLVLDERAREDLAAGRYQDRRKSSSITDGPPRGGARTPSTRGVPARRTSSPQPPTAPRRSWSRSQQELALISSARGMRPDEIAERLGVSRYTATQMLLVAKSRVKL
jgi:hypothetical protein